MLFAAICTGALIAIGYSPENQNWIVEWYLAWEPLAVMCRLLAVIELLWIHVGRREEYPAVLSACLLGVVIVIMIWRIDPGFPTYTFVQVRRFIQIGTAVTLLAGLLMIWALERWRRDAYAAHAAILTLLIFKQALYSVASIRGPWESMPAWKLADWPGLLVTSLCLMLWGALALWSRESRAQPA